MLFIEMMTHQVHAAKSLAVFAYGLLYLLEQTDIWSPWLHVLGLKLTRHFPEPPLPSEEKVKSLAIRSWCELEDVFACFGCLCVVPLW